MLGVLPGVIGLLQATEVLKLLLGIGEPLIGRSLVYDALAIEFRELRVEKDPDCPACGARAPSAGPSRAELHDARGRSRGAVPSAAAPLRRPRSLCASRSRPRRSGHTWIAATPILLLDVREPFEVRICAIEGSMHVPLRHLPARLPELDPEATDRHLLPRGRAQRGGGALPAGARTAAWSLAGGIDAWARRIEPGMPGTDPPTHLVTAGAEPRQGYSLPGFPDGFVVRRSREPRGPFAPGGVSDEALVCPAARCRPLRLRGRLSSPSVRPPGPSRAPLP